jgi:hypothetical protein
MAKHSHQKKYTIKYLEGMMSSIYPQIAQKQYVVVLCIYVCVQVYKKDRGRKGDGERQRERGEPI